MIHPLPLDIGIEVTYTLVIMLICFLIFFKTREAYDLTKHKGLQFFRASFIFLGLAYASRILLYGILIKNYFLLEPFIRVKQSVAMPICSLLVAYFSTMAILYLIYSTVWKKYKTNYFIIFSNTLALLISIITFVSKSPLVLLIIQLILLICLLLLNIQKKHKKKKNSMHSTYFAIIIFWLISLFLMTNQRTHIPQIIKILIQIVSVSIISVVYYKISKWLH